MGRARKAPWTRPATTPTALLASSTSPIGSQTSRPSQRAFQFDWSTYASVHASRRLRWAVSRLMEVAAWKPSCAER